MITHTSFVEIQPQASYQITYCEKQNGHCLGGPRHVMGVLFSQKKFFHRFDAVGKLFRSFGWHPCPPVSCEDYQSMTLEFILGSLLTKELCDQSQQHKDHHPLFPSLSGDCIAVYLGRITVNHIGEEDDHSRSSGVGKAGTKKSTSMHLELFLYFNIYGGKVCWFLGLVNKSKKGNSALDKRLKAISGKHLGWNCHQMAVTLDVHPHWEVQFKAVSTDPTLSSLDDRSIMVFHSRESLNYESFLQKWQQWFHPRVHRIKAPIKCPDTSIGLTKELSDRLTLTTTAMKIPKASKQFKVLSRGDYLKLNKIIPSGYHDSLDVDSSNDCFPIDPESLLLSSNKNDEHKNLFNLELSLGRLNNDIEALIKKIKEDYPDDQERQLFLIGNVAHIFFSSLKWRLGEPDPLPLGAAMHAGTAFDIDQLSLDVWNLGRGVGSNILSNCPFETNTGFLNFHFHNLLSRVFAGQLPSEMNELNFNHYSTQGGIGHTLLPPHKKAIFTQVFDGAHEGDKMRIAVSFTDRKLKSQRQWPLSFDGCECELIKNYHAMDWKERMFTALLLAAKYLNEQLGTPQAFMSNRALNLLGSGAAKGRNSMQCNGGVMLYFLAVLQAAALEEWVLHTFPEAKSFDLAVSVESYGFKQRHAVPHSMLFGENSESRADEIASYFQNLRPTCVVNVIPRFSTYCSQAIGINDPTLNNMYFGVGATCRGVDVTNDNAPLYAAFPLRTVREYLETLRMRSDGSSSPKRDTEDDEDGSDGQPNAKRRPVNHEVVFEEGDENEVGESFSIHVALLSICERFKIPQNGRTHVLIIDFDGNEYRVDQYPTWGGMLTSNLQPFSAIMNAKYVRIMSSSCLDSCFIVKVQSYCVDARYAIGEAFMFRKGCSITGIATFCLQDLSIVIEPPQQKSSDSDPVMQHLRYDHHKKHLDDCEDHLKTTCMFVRKDGVTSRLEVTFKSTRFNDHTQSWRDAFSGLLKMVSSTLRFYDICNEVATCAEFFARGVRSRTDLLVSQLRPSEASSYRIGELLRYMVEEVGVWQRFYNGMNMFYAKSVICKKLAVAASRPILSELSGHLMMRTNEEFEDIERLVEYFYARTCINTAQGINISTWPSAKLHVVHTIDGSACKHCGFIFRVGCSSLEHPCTHLLPIEESDRIKVDSEEYRSYITSLYHSLNEYQRMIVDYLTSNPEIPVCFFLTGYAGTGKTRTLNCVKAKMMSQVGVSRVLSVSYTKAAANEVHGTSIHSLFNLGKNGNLSTLEAHNVVALIREDVRKETVLVAAHTLIIDEVSLLTGNGLDLINETLQLVRNNRKMPFGGMQVILCGDSLQLPPILENAAVGALAQFFFESEAWYKSGFRVGYLQQIYRQSKMTDMLNRIRDGNPTDEDIDILNTECGKGMSQSVLSFLIDEMAALNFNESGDHKSFTHNGVTSTTARKLKYKIQRRYIDNRCGSYSPLCADHPECLMKVLSTDPVIRKEFETRGVIDDKIPIERLLSKFENHFIVGVENVESDHFSKAFENQMKLDASGSITIACESRATDHYYLFDGSNMSTQSKQAIEAELEGNDYARSSNKMDEEHFRCARYSSVREKWASSNVHSRCERLLLYVGLTVIFTSNSVSALVANNTQGIIEELVYDEIETCKLKCLKIRPIGKEGFTHPQVEVYRDKRVFCSDAVDEGKGKFSIVFGVREQFPVKPACWATAYAVQGMTLPMQVKLIFNNIRLSDEAYGYLYVLISRMQDIANFCPLRKITKQDIIAHHMALAFDRIHRSRRMTDNYGRYQVHHVTYSLADLKTRANDILRERSRNY